MTCDDHKAKAKAVGALLKVACDNRRLKLLLECKDQGHSWLGLTHPTTGTPPARLQLTDFPSRAAFL